MIDKVYVLKVDLQQGECAYTYVVSIHRTFAGALKELNEIGPQKWTERKRESCAGDTYIVYFEPDFVPDGIKEAPIDSASIHTEDVLD